MDKVRKVWIDGSLRHNDFVVTVFYELKPYTIHMLLDHPVKLPHGHFSENAQEWFDFVFHGAAMPPLPEPPVKPAAKRTYTEEEVKALKDRIEGMEEIVRDIGAEINPQSSEVNIDKTISLYRAMKLFFEPKPTEI